MVYYNEIDAKAAAWLRELIKRGLIADGDVDERSIADVRGTDLEGYAQCHFFAGIGVWSYALRRAEWADDRPVWTGSCPCQPFSAAGKGEGTADARHLWPEWFRLIRERRPDVCFGEQVEAAIRHSWLDLVQADLEGIGYACGAIGLPAAGVGAPHIRARLFFVAQSEGEQHDGSRNAGGRRGELADGCNVGSMADSGCNNSELGRSNGERAPYSDESEAWERQRVRTEYPAGSTVGGVADSAIPRRPGEGEHDGGQPQLSARPAEHGGMGHTTGDPNDAGSQGRRLLEATGSGNGAGECSAREAGAVNALDDTEGTGRRVQHTKNNGQANAQINTLADSGHRADGARGRQEPGPVNGFWRNAEWLPCIDGKARPVEPGTFPLAHGAPARVGRLRGYGNAINAEVATEFIKAYMTV